MTIREQVEKIERELIELTITKGGDDNWETIAEIISLEDKLEYLYEEARMIRQDLPITYN